MLFIKLILIFQMKCKEGKREKEKEREEEKILAIWKEKNTLNFFTFLKVKKFVVIPSNPLS